MNDMNPTVDMLLRAAIVPIFTHESPEVSLSVIRACYAGGMRVFEYTNRTAGALENFRRLVAAQFADFPDLLLGIGTVFDADTAGRFIDAGAQFVVAPIMNPAVGEVCRQHKVPWLPGCQTLTEVYHALEAGADIIKIFPGEVVGPAFVKSVKSVMPQARLMVTGGVEPTAESLTKWFSAGVSGVGMGSQLFPKEVVAQGDMEAIQQTVEQALAIVKEINM